MTSLPLVPVKPRRLSVFDRLIGELDTVVKTLTHKGLQPSRPSPADCHSEGVTHPRQRRHVAGLMPVNHAGEVCAQALYQGQALTAGQQGGCQSGNGGSVSERYRRADA